METTLIIAAIVQIFLLIFFIVACINISKIRYLIEEFKDKEFSYKPLDVEMVKIAILTGQQKEAYNNIIKDLYKSYVVFCRTPNSSLSAQVMTNKLYRAFDLCKMLNKPLPDELSSLENFKKFNEYNPTTPPPANK